MNSALLTLTLTLLALRAAAAYYPLIDYSGASFFEGFKFYDAIDNTTWGNVTYVDEADATAESLAYINAAGNAIIRVDNTSTVLNEGSLQYRKSVRLSSKWHFTPGSLVVIDAVHMPFGCSVWPSIWMNGILKEGQIWPDAGEIDLIEAINLMDHNQMALHSTAGCVQPQNVTQLGQAVVKNCNDTSASGCTVEETKANSFGAGFANAGGGAFGLQYDTSGIFMWFWSRPNIPASINTSTPTATNMSLADWGTPSASYPSVSCNITEFFPSQELIVDITLCGLWAGIPGVYAAGCNGTCFSSAIAGDGSNYVDAYFEIPFIRTWTVDPAVAAAASASASADAAAASASQASAAEGAPKTGAAQSRSSGLMLATVLAGMLVGAGVALGM